MPCSPNPLALQFGPRIEDDGRITFRLWAPGAPGIVVGIGSGDPPAIQRPLVPLGEGWFGLTTRAATLGSRYRFRRGDRAQWLPDPASRYQPADAHGPSQVIDEFQGRVELVPPPAVDWLDTVLYELHVGTFSTSGDFAGVQARLDALVELGVTAIELMPIADFVGRWNWGYDGVLPYAPESRYGRPEDLRALISAAHRRGLRVFLDVVYNHFGPEGNPLPALCPAFFDGRHQTPWGPGLRLHGPDSDGVRAFLIENAVYWLDRFGFDGLRLDAVDALYDPSPKHLLDELAEAVHAAFPADRPVHLVLENDRNEASRLGAPPRYRAQWNDDLHHALHSHLTGEAQGVYGDFADRPLHHVGRALAEGFAFQGGPSDVRGGQARGESCADLFPTSLVNFLQNHDQIGNRADGYRISELISPEAFAAASALVFLAPGIPMLFMGQEWASRAPFWFFVDFTPELNRRIDRNRRQGVLPGHRKPPPVADPNTVAAARLDWHEAQVPGHRDWWDWHRERLNRRRERLQPLLRRLTPAGAARYRVLSNQVLAVCWPLDDRRAIHLWANLTSDPRSDLPSPGPTHGTVIDCVPETAAMSLRAGALPPWAVVAWLEASESPKR